MQNLKELITSMPTILTHSDGDGVCSAALVKMTKKYRDARVTFTHPMGIAHDLKAVDDDLVVCDIAVDSRAYDTICKELERISESYSVVYIDHHRHPGPLPRKVLNIHDERVSATELVFRHFYHQLPESADRIAMVGAICDYLDDTYLMRELIHHFERRSLFLDAGILAQGMHIYGSEYDKMRNLVIQFSQGLHPCQIKDLVAGAINSTKNDKKRRNKIIHNYEHGEKIAWVMNPKASKSKAAHWILGHSGCIVGITIRTHRHRPEILDMTLRGRNLVDLREYVTKIAHNLGGSGGGHPNACGCRIPIEKKDMFLKILDNTLKAIDIPNPPQIKDLL